MPIPTTRVRILSKDPGFTPGRFQCALVIGVFSVPERRKMFEDIFARQLKKHGEKTLSSYPFSPTIAGVDRRQVEKLVKEQKIDMVFITRLVDQKTIQVAGSGYTLQVPQDPLEGALNYFNAGAEDVSQTGYTVDQTVAVLETKLFESHTGANVWTCRSDTLMNGHLDDLIRAFARVLTQALYAPDQNPTVKANSG